MNEEDIILILNSLKPLQNINNSNKRMHTNNNNNNTVYFTDNTTLPTSYSALSSELYLR